MKTSEQGYVSLTFVTQRTILIAALLAAQFTFAQDIPRVYDVEHTGADFADPVLPSIKELPAIRPLPDPFELSDGSGRSTEFNNWSRRRAEIKREIEHYGIGEKPGRPNVLTASFKDGTLSVEMTENGETLKLTAKVTLPDGDGPFPAVIGIGFRGGTGSLPSEIFSERKVATIAFNFTQVMSHTQKRGKEPINRLYPNATHIGAYSAWSWGISRIIDGLVLVEKDLPIDRKRLAVTGCSFAGKMALFAGAFDERITLTIAQESGGGGAAAWRVSETLGNVETLGKTSRAWFREDMFQFANSVEKLPYDHHELMAMVAPRALLVLGNPDYEWLADESGYVSCLAAHEVWKAFGVADRFGFSIVPGHPHCRLPDNQRPEVGAFVDKFLLGKVEVDTSVTKHPFADVEHELWYDGWTKGKSTFPVPNATNVESIFTEAESANLGADWQVLHDPEASDEKYVTIKSGMNSPQAVPDGAEGYLTIPFEVTRDAKYLLFGRLNCPSADDDSFWLKVDDGKYATSNGLGTKGWEWVKLSSVQLSPGEHRLSLAYREDGAMIDKLCVTSYPFGPAALEDAQRKANKATIKKDAELQPAVTTGATNGQRHRVVVSTDIGGTDPDDFQSMVHLLVYADVLDLEGLVSSPYGPGREDAIFEVIDCYATDFDSLRTYSKNYPTPDALRTIVKQGETERAPYAGVRQPTQGSRWIIECARRKDPRPLNVLVWGGLEDLAQALHDAPDILPKLRVYWIGGPNKKWSPDAYQYIVENHPKLWMIESNATYRGWFTGGNQSGDLGNESFVEKHIRDKGALGKLFVGKKSDIKMGDTPSLGWLLRGNADEPTSPSWGGSFVRAWERPHAKLDRMPTEEDWMELFGILEIALPVSASTKDVQAYLLVENQKLAGQRVGNAVRFRFCPKLAKQHNFKIESNDSSLHGKVGSITVVSPPAETAKRSTNELPHWWTDSLGEDMAVGSHNGAKTVSRYRESFLMDFAKRMQRCAKPSR